MSSNLIGGWPLGRLFYEIGVLKDAVTATQVAVRASVFAGPDPGNEPTG